MQVPNTKPFICSKNPGSEKVARYALIPIFGGNYIIYIVNL